MNTGGNSRWLDVTHFGAKGDGKTDDTAAFRAALDGGGENYRHGVCAGRRLPVRGVENAAAYRPGGRTPPGPIARWAARCSS